MIMRNFSDYWSFTSFILLLAFMGLFYQVAVQYPVIDSFPLIERLLDPSFLHNDFYTNTFKEFSPRLASSKAIVWISQMTGLDYQYVIAYGNIIRIWLYGVALFLLFLSLTDKNTALIAFAFSALSFLSMPFLPAWWPISYDLTSSNIAMVFAMFAWVYAVKGSVQVSFIFLSIAVFIHPVIGIQGVLISIVIYIALHGFSPFLKLFTTISVYPFALLFLAGFLFNYLSYQQLLSDQEFIEINGFFRHAHHFIFSHMDIEKWLSTFLMIALAILITRHLPTDSSDKINTLSYAVISYALLMMAFGYVFVELYPTRFMISFIPMRAFPILVPIIVLAFARLAMSYWNKGSYSNFLLLFLPFLPYHKVGLTWFLFPDSHQLMLPLLIIGCIATLLLLQEFSPFSFKFIDSKIKQVLPKLNISIVLLPIAVLAFLLSVTKFNINIPTLENSKKVYSWLKDNTSEDDLIISEINATDNQKVRLVARRPIVISKDFPFNEIFYKEWQQRYSDVYATKEESRGHIDSLTESELNHILDKYNATILIRTKAFDSPEEFTLIGQAQGEKAMSYIYRNKEL